MSEDAGPGADKREPVTGAGGDAEEEDAEFIRITRMPQPGRRDLMV